jgi:hypothetical protein
MTKNPCIENAGCLITSIGFSVPVRVDVPPIPPDERASVGNYFVNIIETQGARF